MVLNLALGWIIIRAAIDTHNFDVFIVEWWSSTRFWENCKKQRMCLSSNNLHTLSTWIICHVLLTFSLNFVNLLPGDVHTTPYYTLHTVRRVHNFTSHIHRSSCPQLKLHLRVTTTNTTVITPRSVRYCWQKCACLHRPLRHTMW